MPIFTRVPILDVPFIRATKEELLTVLQDRINRRINTFVVTANPEIVMHAQTDKAYLKTLKEADFVTPDGIGIIKGAKILKTPLPERITGYDTMIQLLEWGNQKRQSVYMVGAKQAVIEDVNKVLSTRYPNLTVAGSHNGYFDTFDAIAKDIAKTQPDMVFLAVGFPKQEQLIAQYRHVNDGLWMGVGGSFDVLSGHVKRAPKFFQNYHLEWFYRLVTNPTRFKRMLTLPRYLQAVRRKR